MDTVAKDAIMTAFEEELRILRAEQSESLPSPPPNCDPALLSLLKSWYEAGYHTGRYEALQELRNPSNSAPQL